MDGREYWSQTMAGRSLFQIDDVATGNYICLIFDETSAVPRGGLQGIRCEEELAEQYLKQAVEDWQNGKIKFEHQGVLG